MTVAAEPIDRRLSLALLDEPSRMSRDEIPDDHIEELAADIRQRGLINPIAVVPNGERFRIIAGHCRFLACERAGLEEVRCSIYETEEQAAQGIKFAENRFRRDLTPAAEAAWFAEELEATCGGDVDRLCAHLGIKRGYAERRLSLILGDAQVFEAVKANKITLGVAEKLNECTEEMMRRSYLFHAMRDGATIAVVTAWVADWKASQIGRREMPAAPTPVPIAGATIEAHPQYCYVCRKVDPRFIPMAINVHQHCQLAVLDKLLGSYHGDGESS